MRILFLTLILLTGSLNHSVLADDNIPNQPIQKVDSTSLHLLGGGIENRKTNEIIALGCVNQQCNELRLVYLTSTLDEAYFFGPIIPVVAKNEVPTEAEFKATLKKISKDYKISKKERHPNRLLAYCILGGQFGMTSFVYITALATPASWPLFVGLGLFTLGVKVIANNTVIFSKSTTTEILQDQSGWNWSLKTKKVSRKNFEAMMDLGGTELETLHAIRK